MTARSTRPSTIRLWTGVIALLLVTGSAGSDGATALDEAATSQRAEVIAGSPSGSVEPLRKPDAAVDARSTTLKYVHDVPEAVVDGTAGSKLSDAFATESNGTRVERGPSGDGGDGGEKPQIGESLAKLSRLEDKPGSRTSQPEFSENEDNGEIDDPDGDDDAREPTTPPPPKREVDGGSATPTDVRPKGHEAERPEERGPEVGASLANDTNVNYSGNKRPLKKSEGDDSGGAASGPKSHLENATNVIATGADAADGPGKGKGPKAQVEVVKGTTLPKAMRITEAVAADERKEVESLGSPEPESVVETSRSTVIPGSPDLPSVGEKTSSVPTRPSAADVDSEKRGRTISFGGGNEFVTNENKTAGSVRDNGEITDSPVGETVTGVTDEPVRGPKSTDFKPYPYTRTNHQSNSSEVASRGRSRDVESTEEASALENTIGQSQQDKKFVVTEPSVVIDNSIQQFKPTYYKRSGNASRIATSSPTTATSLEDGGPGATTTSAESHALGNDTTVFVPSPPIFNTGNDVPLGKDETAESSAGAKDTVSIGSGSNLDLTGNGITEVIAGVKNDSIRVLGDSVTTASTPRATGGPVTSRATDDALVQSSTEKIAAVSEQAAPTSVDVQTDPEESMLKISALNVTEGSTEIAADQRATDSATATPGSSTTTPSPESPATMSSTPESPAMSTSTSTSMPPATPSTSENSTTIPKTSSVSLMTETSATTTSSVSSTTDSGPTNSSTLTSTATTTSLPSIATSAGVIDGKLESQTTVAPDDSTDGLTAKTRETEELSSDGQANESTTPKIEYVFVGLTESTASQRYIATSESPNAVTPDRELASSSQAPSAPGFSTFAPTAEVASTSPSVIPVNGSESSTVTEMPEEISTQPMTLSADNETTEDLATTEPSVELATTLEHLASTADEEATESSGGTTTMNDDPATTLTNDESAEMTTEEVAASTNSTDAPGIVVPDVGENTTDTGRAVESSSRPPDAVDANAGNSGGTTVGSTETTSQSITEEPPRISVANLTSARPTESATSERSSVNTTSRNSGSNSGPTTTPTRSTTPRTETPTTSNGTVGSVTDGSIEIVHRGGVPALVKVVFEGGWADVCPHLDVLRQSLADLLTSGLEKTVQASQIVFQNNPCSSGYSASTMTTETSITTLLLYVVDEYGNFDGEMTKTLPTLYSKSPIKLQVNIRSFQLVQDSDSGNAIAVVVVSCVALICLVLLAGLLFIMRKRQTRFNYGERCRPVSLDAYSLDSVSAYNSVRRKGAARASKRSYGNPTFEDSSAIPSHPLNFAGLSSFCNEQNAISEEFAGIPQVTARIDELPQGAEVKNRYANVVPLPETRVSLMKINNDPLTEYINASYVRGPKNATKYYIACQAPIESTVTDFWRMIWEQQSKVVIMLTDLVENGVEKCAEYIPPSEVTDCHRLFGDFQVALKKRETKEKYAISTLHLKNLENNTFREISHIWYLWPANGVQSDAAGLIAVLLEARALQRGGPGPIVVHCSPGTGRTGTLIALDLGIRQYEITRTVDVPRVVYTIRRDRAGAVQTKEQYAFIYKALNLYATKLAGGALDS